MNNLPWHPIVVHFPLVMAFLVPLGIAAVFVGRRRGPLQLRSWWLAVSLGGLLAVGSVVALNTGKNDEERVEEVVAGSALEDHEEAGEAFMWASIALLAFLLPLPYLRTRRLERLAAIVALAGGIAVSGLALRVGHSGGSLIYRHGAAVAYGGGTARGDSGVPSSASRDGEEREEREDRRERH